MDTSGTWFVDATYDEASGLTVDALLGTDLASSRALCDAEDQTRLVAVHLLRVVAKTAIAAAAKRGEQTDDLVAAVIRAGADAWRK